MTIDDIREEVEDRSAGVRTFPSIGCQIVLSITPARRADIADRLESALPPGWDIVSEFHRTTDDGIDLFFHRVETHNDRVDVDTLFDFGDKFAEIDEQLNIERVKEDSPELFEDAIEDFGRQRALEMFADVGGSGANLVQITARPEGEVTDDMQAEVLVRADLRHPITEDRFQRIVATEFMGQLLRVERATETAYLLGGSLTHNIETVQETIDFLEEQIGVNRDDTAVVCRVIEA